jgi:ubiquitin carboxyl-terminal hydrolase L5
MSFRICETLESVWTPSSKCLHGGSGILRSSSCLLFFSLGYLITNSDRIRQVHNSFSASSPFAISQHPSLQSDKEDPYHFVAYVPVQGCLWELDGLRRGPVKHGVVDERGEGWVGKAREVIEKRIATYGEGSVRLSLTQNLRL